MKWEKYKFTDLVKDITGGNHKLQSQEYLPVGKYPIIDQGEKFISGYTDQQLMIKRTSDVVVFGDHTKYFKYVDFDFCLGADGVKVLEPIEHLDAKFLFYHLQNIQLPNVGYSRHYKFLKEVTIPLPPLATQKRIAAILDAADALRRKDQALLQKYDELAQAIFVDIFGDPVKNEKGWEVSTIGQECVVKGGKRLPLGDSLVKENTGFPYIKAGNIKAGTVHSIDLEYLLASTQRKIKNYTVKAGDVCVTIVGANIGDVGIVPAELDGANLTENAAKILTKNKEKLNNVYLANYWRMPFVQEEIKKRSMAVGVPKLALFRIEEIFLLIPPIAAQINFNNAMNKLSLHMEKSIQSSSFSETLFQSLLQKAFNAELVP